MGQDRENGMGEVETWVCVPGRAGTWPTYCPVTRQRSMMAV